MAFELDVVPDSPGHGHTFTFLLHEEGGKETLRDTLREEREGAITSLEEVSRFALVAHHLKQKTRRVELGLPVEQDRPGCDAVYDSCGSNGQCCDDHDACLEYHNDTSQSRAQLRLKGSHNCLLGAFGCGAWHLICPSCGGASDCCRIPYPDPPPQCLPYNTQIQCLNSAQCCNGAEFSVDCLESRFNWTWCAAGPNPEPGNICQRFDAEFSTWGGHPFVGYWSNARCGDGVCSPGEFCSNYYSSYDGNCNLDCGLCPTYCGDGACRDGETCESCDQDCGACYCGDGRCNGGETCDSCPTDCGGCAYCGDGSCNNGETCGSCEQDCGACSTCGNGVCDGYPEDCGTCPGDCPCPGGTQCENRQCVTFCGNGSCDGGEDCGSCPRDCGGCATCYDTCENWVEDTCWTWVESCGDDGCSGWWEPYPCNGRWESYPCNPHPC